jgi:hypothetical protein
MSADRPVLTDLTPDKLKGIGGVVFMRLKDASGATEAKPGKIEFSNGYSLKTIYLGDEYFKRIEPPKIHAIISKGSEEALDFEMNKEDGVYFCRTKRVGFKVGDKVIDVGDRSTVTLVKSMDSEFADRNKSGSLELGLRLTDWLVDSIESKDKILKPCPITLESVLLP